MNHFIIDRLGLLTLVGAICAAGCAVTSTSQVQGDEAEQGDSEVATEEDEFVAGGRYSIVRRSGSKPNSGHCAGCGPLPEPWQMGPLPEPWTEPKPSSSSSGSNGGDGKP